MAVTTGRKLTWWWALAVAAVIAAHFLFDALGLERTGKGIAEAVVIAALAYFPYALMKRMVLPLEEIMDTSRRIAAGDLKARSDADGPPEFRELSDSLNTMVEKLANAYEELVATNQRLEKTVEERTRALTVEHEKLSGIFRNIPDGVIFISVTGEVLDVNPVMEEIWGAGADEIKGKLVDDLPEGPIKQSIMFDCDGKQTRKCWEVFNCIEKECPAYNSEDRRCWLISGTFCHKGRQVSVKRKREEICSECSYYRELMEKCCEVREIEISGRHYKTSGALVLDSENRAMGEIKTFYDITEEKLLEKRKADFVSLVTHDLKSPLASIIGYTDLLLSDTARPEDDLEYLGAVRRGAAKLLDMVEQYLDLTKFEAGMLRLYIEKVSPREFLNEALDGLRVLADEKRISLMLDAAEDLPTVEADRERLARVVTNLVSNSIKFTQEGGWVVVSARPANGGGSLEITVSDNGCGIAEEDIPHIFDTYYRSVSAEKVRGTGLGLAVVKSITEAHGGSVHVDSRRGKGSAFTVTIPLAGTK